MKYRAWLLLAVPVVLVSFWACPSDDDGTGGEDAGVTADGGTTSTGKPADTVVSFGVTNAGNGAPQPIAKVNLKFESGTASATTLVSKRVSAPVTIDGDDSEWEALPESHVNLEGTGRGDPIGLSQQDYVTEMAAFNPDAATPVATYGINYAKFKSAYDDEYIYFLAQWPDPAPGLEARTWTHSSGGTWSRPSTGQADDRVYVAFSINNSIQGWNTAGCGTTCHMKQYLGMTNGDGGSLPEDAGGNYDYPADGSVASFRRSMHTKRSTEFGDVWAWRSIQTDPVGLADDQYWDYIKRWPDGTSGGTAAADFWGENVVQNTNRPKYVPADFSADASILLVGDGGNAVPYDPNTMTVPDGAKVPGMFYLTEPVANRAHISAKGKWKDGVWTVELRRKLVTDDPRDTQFPLQPTQNQ